MYVIINSKTYEDIKSLSFVPQVDITGDSVPVNEFSVHIKTTDNIAVGQWASLYDDLGNLWAQYWIVFADRVDALFLEIKAQSIIGLLDRVTMVPEIYVSGTSASGIITACFTAAGVGSSVTIDSSLSGATVTGYLPEQTARDRLQWVCFAICAYVKQEGVQNIQIKSLDTSSQESIPMNKTFWKPSIEYKDYVTSINLTSYEFTQGTPGQGDQYVTVNDIDYIITSQKFTLSNSSAPESALPSEVNVDGCYLINDENADDIASRLAMIYFARTSVSADVINNHEYVPPQKVALYLDQTRGAIGYIESADFSFGLQARSTLKVVASETRTLAQLIISYTFNGAVVATKTYSFPVGYQYSILNPYLDISSESHRYIYRPLTEYCTGTMTSGTNRQTVACEVALHWYSEYQLLRIVSVSEIEYDSTDNILEIS